MGNQNERTLIERFTRQRREGIALQRIAWNLGYSTVSELYQALAQKANESGVSRDFMFRTDSNQSASSDSAKRATSKAANGLHLHASEFQKLAEELKGIAQSFRSWFERCKRTIKDADEARKELSNVGKTTSGKRGATQGYPGMESCLG